MVICVLCVIVFVGKSEKTIGLANQTSNCITILFRLKLPVNTDMRTKLLHAYLYTTNIMSILPTCITQ